MGRKIKYTEKQRKELNKTRCKEYYERNKERIKENRMRRYWGERNQDIGYVSGGKRQKKC